MQPPDLSQLFFPQSPDGARQNWWGRVGGLPLLPLCDSCLESSAKFAVACARVPVPRAREGHRLRMQQLGIADDMASRPRIGRA